jgi:hypothetical protein
MESGLSPKQRSHLMDKYALPYPYPSLPPSLFCRISSRQSLFAKAISDGLNGNIIPSKAASPYISCMDLFNYLRTEMKRNLSNCEEVFDENGRLTQFRQDPVLFVPSQTRPSSLPFSCDDLPVCCQCGPPAQPDTPFVIRCKPNSALLEWMMPPFDGVPPLTYKVYMRNNCRIFYDWSVVPGAENVPYQPDQYGAVRYNVNHLPSGVRVEFCISAYNKGGWSELSKPSVSVTPGEELQPQSISLEWKKTLRGGPLAILDRLARYPQYRDEHLRGMKSLLIFAQKEGIGFSRANIREKVIQLVIHSLQEFSEDHEIASLCFMLVGYSVYGQGAKQLRIRLLQAGFVEIVERFMRNHRTDSKLMNAVHWLRRVMPKDIPENPEQKLLPFGTVRNEEDEEDEPLDEMTLLKMR